MDHQKRGQNNNNNQQVSQNQQTSQQRQFQSQVFVLIRSENNQDNQQFKEKKAQSELITNQICENLYLILDAQAQSMESSIQRQFMNEPNNPNDDQGHEGNLNQQDFKVEGNNQEYVRSNQTTLTAMPHSVKQYLIDDEKASKSLLQYQEEYDDDLIDLLSEVEDEQKQRQNQNGQQHSDSDSVYDFRKKWVIVLPEEPPQQSKQQISKTLQRRSKIKLSDAQFIDQYGYPIEKLDIFNQNGPVTYNPKYKFYIPQQQNQMPEQVKQNEPETSSILLTSFSPIDDKERYSDQEQDQQSDQESDQVSDIKDDKEVDQKNDKEVDKEGDNQSHKEGDKVADKVEDKVGDKEVDKQYDLEEEKGKPLLKQRRQKEFTFLQPKVSKDREIKKLSKEELKSHTKQKLNREAIQYRRNQQLKQQLRKENGTDNIPEETIDEKLQRLTNRFEEKLQIIPSDNIMEQIQYFKKDSTFQSKTLSAMDQQRAIWLKHGFIGHLKPKPGFRFHQLYEKSDECLIDEDDPYGIKGPFIPLPEDRIKFERLHQQQLRDSSSMVYKNQIKMQQFGGQAQNQAVNSLFQQSNNQQNNPFLNNQTNLYQNNPFQTNPQQNTMFQNNPLQNNLFQNNFQQNNNFYNNSQQIFQNNPQQNNIFQSNSTNPFQNQQNSVQNNPFLKSFQSAGNNTGNLNQQPVQNLFGVNTSAPNLFNQGTQNLFGVSNDSQRQNSIPQTFKQSQSPMRYRVNSYQNNINQQSNWNKNTSAYQQPIPLQGPQQPLKQAYNPFQPPPLANQANNAVNKLPDIFQPQPNNLNIPPLQNIFQQNQPQNVPSQGTNRYNTRSNNRVNNFR
ncbi:hypothetical protein pb186bvf_012006 [Paramecium bursaria]